MGRSAVEDERDGVAELVDDRRRVARPPARRRRLAEVVGIGPTAAASARGASWSGTRRPIVGAPPVSAGGQGDVGSLRDDQGEAARPERLGERGRGRRPLPDRRRLGRVGEEQHDRPVGRPLLGREQRLDAARRVERDRDPVDRVGRQGDDPAGAEDARSPRPARRRRPGRSGRSRRRARQVAPPTSGRARPRAAAAARAASAGDASTSSLDQLGGALLGRAAARGSARPPGPAPARVGIAAPWPTAGDHLEVVELVADREDAAERHAGRVARGGGRRRAFETPGREELEEARMADRHRGPAGEPPPAVGEDGLRDRVAGGRRRDHLRDRVAQPGDEVVGDDRPGRRGTTSSPRRAGRRPG